jgi:hypothetical protein
LPHVVVALTGRFKNKVGEHNHLLTLAETTPFWFKAQGMGRKNVGVVPEEGNLTRSCA